MDDFSALSDGERALLEALNRHGVRFMLSGQSERPGRHPRARRSTGGAFRRQRREL